MNNQGRQVQIINSLFALTVASMPSSSPDTQYHIPPTYGNSDNAITIQSKQPTLEELLIAHGFSPEDATITRTFEENKQGIHTTVTMSQRLATQKELQNIPTGYNITRISMQGQYTDRYDPKTGKGAGYLTITYAELEDIAFNSGDQLETYELTPANSTGWLLITSNRVQSERFTATDGTVYEVDPTLFFQPIDLGPEGTVTDIDIKVEDMSANRN